MRITIIGSGPGGYVAAIKAAQLKAEVTIIEEDKLGGTCLNYGCIPTKALIASASLVNIIRESNKFGIEIKNVNIDFTKIMARKDKIVEQLRMGIDYLFKKNKINLIYGKAEIVDKNLVKVKDKKIITDKIIIASGSKVLKPQKFPFYGKNVLTSDEALSLKELPKTMLIIGGGVIGIELAVIFNSLGTKVTIVEIMEQILIDQDKELVNILTKELNKQGIEIFLQTEVSDISLDKIKLSNGKELKVEKVVIAIGRTLNSEQFKNLPLEFEKDKIKVNQKMETNIPGIYAIGDVTNGKLLAHKASYEGIIAANNAIGIEKIAEYNAIPSCIFSLPPLASCGLTEKEAINKGYKIKIGRFPYRALGKALTDDKFIGMFKVITDIKTDKILGIHIFGDSASEIISEASLAIKQGFSPKQILETIHTHPTFSEGLQEACANIYNETIHI